MFHINQSLTMILPHVFNVSEETALKQICFYNTMISFIVVSYLGMLFWIFYAPDIQVQIVLSLNLAFRIVLLLIFILTVIELFSTLKHFPAESMSIEIVSVKRQFVSFLIAFMI